ncbi:conserved Plasmodium protein, unknown function [Plasmodium vinckei]|uniref:Cleavage and polyadenylation specificity factor subunit 2 n=1 Tax=Plasmodium vinckei TaxID=5860 RepID=A0A6V7SS44_PLAVN|nr:conserved Plasmodium protein, unknown function [Plasmodium vinckei]
MKIKKKKKKKEIQDNNEDKKQKKQNKNFIFESNEEMVYIKKTKNKQPQQNYTPQLGNNDDNIQPDQSKDIFLKDENAKEESFFEFFKKKKKKDKQENMNNDPTESSSNSEPENEGHEEEEDDEDEEEDEEDEEDEEEDEEEEEEGEEEDEDEEEEEEGDENLLGTDLKYEEMKGTNKNVKFGENFYSYKQNKSEIRIKRELNNYDENLNNQDKFSLSKKKTRNGVKIKMEKSESDVSSNSQEDETKWENRFIKYNNEKGIQNKMFIKKEETEKTKNLIYTNIVDQNEDNQYNDINNSSIGYKKNSWKTKLLKYFKTIPTISKEEKVSIQINCKIKIFDIEYVINQNTLKTILFQLNPKHFVLLPSCDSYSSLNFEMLFYSSIKNCTKIHTFYSPNYFNTIKENMKDILYERFFFRNALSIDSVNIPLNVQYENVYIKNIYTLINSMTPDITNFHIFKAKVSFGDTKERDPNLPSNQRRKRFINEHSTFWNEYKGSEYTLSLPQEKGEIEDVGISSKVIQNKADENKVEEEKNNDNADENEENKKKDKEDTTFLNYYIDDDQTENQSDDNSEDISSLSSQDEDSYLQNEINDEQKLKGELYIGDVSIKNLLTSINNFPNVCLNFVNENQIILDGKASIKKESLININPNEKTQQSNNRNNVTWKIESSLDPSFYFLRNVLKDLHNNMSI